MYFSGNYHYKKVHVIHQCMYMNRLISDKLCLFSLILHDYQHFPIAIEKLGEIRRIPVNYPFDNGFFPEFLRVFTYFCLKISCQADYTSNISSSSPHL